MCKHVFKHCILKDVQWEKHRPQVVPCGVGLTKSKHATFCPSFAASYKHTHTRTHTRTHTHTHTHTHRVESAVIKCKQNNTQCKQRGSTACDTWLTRQRTKTKHATSFHQKIGRRPTGKQQLQLTGSVNAFRTFDMVSLTTNSAVCNDKNPTTVCILEQKLHTRSLLRQHLLHNSPTNQLVVSQIAEYIFF